MISAINRGLTTMVQLNNNTIKQIFITIFVGISCLFLASCGGEEVRTENEYLKIASEAHAKGDSKLAIFELSKGISHYPNNPDLQLLRGKVFLDLEDGSAAEIAFNKAINLGYNANFIKHEIAESWLYQRNPNKIIEQLEGEILSGSKDALIYEVVGRAYIASRDQTNPTLFIQNVEKARQYIDEAYNLNPNNTRILITKAWLPAMMGKLDESIEWLDKADLIVKDQRENLAMKGELLVRQDKIEQSQKVYQILVKKFPQYPQYKIELGYTYLLNRDYTKARALIEPIARQYPNQLRTQYLLSNISLMEKKYDDAQKLSEAVLVKTPEDLNTILINGASSFFLRDYENAHQKLSLFYNKTASVSALKLLAATKLKLNENLDASKLLEVAGQKIDTQSDSELLNLVAIASARIGKTDVSLEAYKKLAEQKPDEATYRNNIGLLQIAQGNYDEGFETLEESLGQDKEEKEAGQDLYILAGKALNLKQYDRAADYIEQYKNIAGESYKPWIMSAVLQNILRNYDAVRRDFNKAVELAPNNAGVKARYAIFESMQDNMDKATALAKETLDINPSDIGAGKLLLNELVKQKKFDDIRNIVDKAVQYDSATPSSKLIFADYYILLGSPQETLDTLNQLPDPLKETATYKYISGKAFLRNGQAQSAVDMFEKFSHEYPDNIQALKYLLQGYVHTGDTKKYQSTLENLNRIEPNDFENQLDLAKLYIMTDKYDLAAKSLNSLAPENENQILLKKIMRATMETKLNNIKRALMILAPLNQQYPDNGAVSMLYSKNLANDNQLSEAIEISQIWTNKHPNNVDAKIFLGDLYLKNKNKDKASKLYEDIITLVGNVKSQTAMHAHNNLAMIYMDGDQLQKAKQHAQISLDMAPNNPAIIDTYAHILMKQGKADQAIEHFNHAIALLPPKDHQNLSLFTFGKAKALIQMERKEEARKILTRLIKDDPQFSQLAEVKNLLSNLDE